MTTESAGVFEFTSLPPGRYFLGLSRRGYMSSGFPEGGRTMRSRVGVTLTDGQVMENVTASLYHGGAITGRLVDAYGDPMDNVSVQVLRAGGTGRMPQPFSSGMANDIGEYRVSQLSSGSYLLMAIPHGTGRYDANGVDAPVTAPVPTYYPGVLSPDQAQPIVVERGQTLTGMDFQVIEQGVTSVSGTVLDVSGQPAAGGNINVERDNTNSFGSFGGGGSSIKPDGTFELKLAPGEYRLTAFVTRRDAQPGRGQAEVVVRSAQFDERPQMGLARVSVGTESIANLVIAAGAGSTIAGKLTFDGDGPPPDPGRIQINAQGAGAITTGFSFRRGSNDCRPTGAGKVNPDMTFTIEAVRGTCVLSVGIQDPRWRARSATYHGADLLDRPVELSSNHDVRDVQISVTTRRTELTTEVTGDQGESLQDYVVLAFSTEKARWTLGRYLGFTMRSASSPLADAAARQAAPNISDATRRQGVMTTLPPGDYYVIALDDIGIDDSREPAFLEQLVPNATRVTLREGEPQTVTLHRLTMPAPAQ
jgi:hypothetical protein